MSSLGAEIEVVPFKLGTVEPCGAVFQNASIRLHSQKLLLDNIIPTSFYFSRSTEGVHFHLAIRWSVRRSLVGCSPDHPPIRIPPTPACFLRGLSRLSRLDQPRKHRMSLAADMATTSAAAASISSIVISVQQIPITPTLPLSLSTDPVAYLIAPSFASLPYVLPDTLPENLEETPPDNLEEGLPTASTAWRCLVRIWRQPSRCGKRLCLLWDG